MAPEVCLRAYNYKADVFSFGMLLWEILHVDIPFSRLSAPQVLLAYVQELRPRIKLPEGLQKQQAFQELICACWYHDSAGRPEMCDVVLRLEDLVSTGMEQVRVGDLASSLKRHHHGARGSSAEASAGKDNDELCDSHHTAKRSGSSVSFVPVPVTLDSRRDALA